MREHASVVGQTVLLLQFCTPQRQAARPGHDAGHRRGPKIGDTIHLGLLRCNCSPQPAHRRHWLVASCRSAMTSIRKLAVAAGCAPTLMAQPPLCETTMSFQTSISPIAPNTGEIPTRFEVRTVWLGFAIRPYGWEIVNELTGEVVRRSSARYRKPSEAWAAGGSTSRCRLRRVGYAQISSRSSLPTESVSTPAS